MENKHAIAAILVVAIMVFAGCSAVLYSRTHGSDDPPGPEPPGPDDPTMYYARTQATRAADEVIEVFYTDDYFRHPSTEYHIGMAAFALGLELTCSHRDAQLNRLPDWAIQFMKEIGCKDVQMFGDFNKKDDMYSINGVLGWKEIDGYTTIFVNINGVCYNEQFGSNMVIGASGDHEGFSIGAQFVLKSVKEYVEAKSLSGKSKMLLTGFSRGAAVCNLASARIDDAIAENTVADLLGNITLTKEDTYSFGFMTPMGAASDNPVSPTDERYSNIINFVDPNDLIPMMAPAQLGFERYGRTILLDTNNPLKVGLWGEYVRNYLGKDVYDAYSRANFRPDTHIQGVTQGEICAYIVDILATGVGSRQNYVDNIQDDTANALFYLRGDLDFASALMSQLTKVQSIVVILQAFDFYHQGLDVLQGQLHALVDPVVEEWQKGQQAADQIVNMMCHLVEVLDLKYEGSMDNLVTDPYMVTFYTNVTILINMHYPPNLIGWIYMDDPDYPIGGL